MDKLLTTRKERFRAPEVSARDDFIRRHAASLPQGSWVLDAGAGASKYRPLFSHCRYQTQDFCQYQGAAVQYLEPIDYVCDITRIPLPDGSLEAIVCTEVIEHVVNPMAALAEFARLLKPGGRLFLTAPMLSHLHMAPYHFYGGFTHYWYRHWLPLSGLTIDELIPVGGPGRSCVVFAETFCLAWKRKEEQLPPIQKWLSKFARMLFKLPVHYLLPLTLPRLDRWIGSELICSSYLVSATKR